MVYLKRSVILAPEARTLQSVFINPRQHAYLFARGNINLLHASQTIWDPIINLIRGNRYHRIERFCKILNHSCGFTSMRVYDNNSGRQLYGRKTNSVLSSKIVYLLRGSV